jgi:hypothetical protein
MHLTSILVMAGLLFSFSAQAGVSQAIANKIISQGVPADALHRLTKFMDENEGRKFNQDIYTCEGQEPTNVKPCEDKKRKRDTIQVSFAKPENVVIVNFTAPSTERRFFLINLPTGKVQSFYTAHGLGSGRSNYATKFSNIKDSRQTSLGIYLTGETYKGSYGRTLRMYGLERSNDQAYNRDIVVHGAWYVGEDFINTINSKTGEPFGRLGLSWGCPALSLYMAARVIPVIQEGSLIMHYHAALQDEAQSGKEVQVPGRVVPPLSKPTAPEAPAPAPETELEGQ